MKKIFSFIAGVVAAMSLQAASYTEAALITMTCDGGSELQELQLFVDPALASPVTVQNLASTYEVGQVNMYVSYNNGKYSSFKANAISNLPLTIVTNRRDASYTFTFNVPISTDGLVLTDLRSVDGIKNIPMVNNGSYTFSIEDETGYDPDNKSNLTIADRFVINYVAPAPACDYSRDGLTIGRYYTICLPKAVENPTGASFWNLRYRNDEGTLAYLEEATGALVAGRPYIFQAEATELCFEYSGDAEPAGDFGALVGTFEEMDQDALDLAGTDIYLLYNNELWLVSGRTDNVLPENRAYIAYDELIPGNPASAPGRRVRAIPMQGQVATGIETLNAAEAPAKTIIDGKLYIIRDKHMFDATGRMVK